jgi:DNA-binding transcriptional LysR family regulator
MYDWAELRHFRYLLAILEEGGLRAAAEKLHTSQPNLTVQARQFQENAQVRLFRRLKTGRIRPTKSGAAFIALARLLLEHRDDVIDALIAIEKGDIQSVCLGCSSLVDPDLLRHLCMLHKSLLPTAIVRPTHGDAVQLVQEILEGTVDAALITLPVSHPEIRVEEIIRDRLVICLCKDNPLAEKACLDKEDLQQNLGILYHPERHLDAHERLLELLNGVGIHLREYSRASHPTELQALVKEGYGFALIREGTALDPQLTTRAIAGVNWTVDTAIIYHLHRFPKSIPVMVRKFRREYGRGASAPLPAASRQAPHLAPRSRERAAQLSFADDEWRSNARRKAG